MCQGKKKASTDPDDKRPLLPLIEVGIPLPVYTTFTYEVPDPFLPFVSPGKRVLVPFKRRTVTGYILGHAKPNLPMKIKKILDVLDDEPLFPETMIPFYRWMANYYIHPIGEVVRNALPRGLTSFETTYYYLTTEGRTSIGGNDFTPIEKQILDWISVKDRNYKDIKRITGHPIPHSLLLSLEKQGLLAKVNKMQGGTTTERFESWISLAGKNPIEIRMTPGRLHVLEALASSGTLSIKELVSRIPNAANVISGLAKSGAVVITKKRSYRDPFGEVIESDSPLPLTSEQRNAVSAIIESLGNGFRPYLLAGVTGSGKTEVYLQAAAAAIQKGFSVLVLVPEISLISQIERRFRARFGEVVALVHSGLSAGERFDQWRRMTENRAFIAVGTRSAIFSPLTNLGLIIVDEEHDSSYKQESQLRYNARDIAIVRAKHSKAVVVLGSATPSVQSFYNVSIGKFTPLILSKRVAERPMPKIEIVDLKRVSGQRGIRRFITPELHAAMTETLSRKEQILLFLNRRGFANFPVCKTCGDPVRCNHCDISMTLHQNPQTYQCHLCGFSLPSSATCPTCGSSNIHLLGLGTEKVESAVQKLFPEARVARMDRDSTSQKGSILNLLKALRNSQIDILVGTQMIAKGHDFPNITLVGIICADLSLSFPDFRAGELTFQLLAQVSGRAGRGDQPGRVVLQTYNPNHFSILFARDQNYKGFYDHEIAFRKALHYPPYTRLIHLRISGKDRQRTAQTAREVGRYCQEQKTNELKNFESVEILGPIESPLPRIAGLHRWQILLKGSRVQSLRQFVQLLISRHQPLFLNQQIKIIVDVDPLFML